MIALIITTRNRPKVFSICLFNYAKFSRIYHKIIIIDDNSTPENQELNKNIITAARTKYACNITYIYNPQRLGVAKSKNQGLKQAKGCNYILLSDDDVFPVKANYWKPFIRSFENTGNHHFQYLKDNALNGGIKKTRSTNGIHEFNTGSGCLLFLTAQLLEKVGGFNPGYDLYGYEHIGYSYRINAMGLTPDGIFLCPADIIKYMHSLDIDGVPAEYKNILDKFESTEPTAWKQEMMNSREGKMTFEYDLKNKYYQDL